MAALAEEAAFASSGLLDAPKLVAFIPGQETVVRSRDGKVEVRVPGDALVEQATIEYSERAPFTSTGVKVFRQFDLRARAALEPRRPIERLDAPVTIAFGYDPVDVRGLDFRTYRISYFNPVTGLWEDLETQHDVQNRTLVARTSHFSIFGATANPAYALQGMVHNSQADMHSGGTVFEYPIELPRVPGGALPGVSLVYNSGIVNETKNHRDVASWVGNGWDLSLPHIFYNEQLDKHYLSLNGLQAELVRNSDDLWYTRPDLNLKIEGSVSGGPSSVTKAAGAGASVDTESAAAWTNPGNIAASDNAYAVGDVPASTRVSDTLRATNFGFNIPSSATIDGIEVTVERKSNTATTYDHILKLVKAGSPVGQNKAVPDAWPTTDGLKTYGSSTELWGASWTAADINASNFGFDLQATVSPGDPTAAPSVDHIQMTVYYTHVVTTSGPNPAGAGASVDTESAAAWTNPGNIAASDNAYAVGDVPASTRVSDTLRATNFGFNIPSSATIDGIEVTVERKSNTATTYDHILKLVKAGSPVGQNKAVPDAWPTTDGLKTYGSSTELWGASWTPADINASNFGFDLQATVGPGDPTAAPSVDHVQITVYFSRLWGRQAVTSRSAAPGAGVDGVTATTTYSYSADPEYFIPAGKSAFDGEFRGFRQVTSTRGDGTYEKHFFYTTATTTVSHPISGSVSRDGDRLKGHKYKVEVYDASNTLIQRSFTDWNYEWVSQPDDIYEVRADNQGVEVFAPAGTSVRRRAWTYLTYDPHGNVTKVDDRGDYDETGDERTTYRGFATSTSAWIVDRPYFERRYAGTVGADDPGSSSLRSQTKFYYDGQAYGTAPVKGDLTKIEQYTVTSTLVTTTHAYDMWGNVATTTDPRGNSTTYTYDPTYHTYLTQVTYPAVAGGTFATSYTWDFVKGVKLSETDWNGNVTSFEYDASGRPTKVIRPGDDSTNPTERYTYLSWGTQGQQRVKVEQKTSGSNYLWQEEYFDGLGRIAQVRQQDDSGFSAISSSKKFNNRELVSNEYAPWRVTATTTAAYQSPAGIESAEYSYDALGRVLTATSTDGSVATHVYEGHSDSFLLWEERITDPLGEEKRFSTDVYGRVARVQEMQGAQVYRATTFSYDTLGNLIQVVVDPQLDGSLLNATTTMTYDWLGRKLSLDNPDTGAWSYAYDANSNLTTQTDARGQVLTFEYDALNRHTKKCATNCSTTVLATYAYDSGTNGRGHRTWMTDQSGSATSTYDGRGRLIQEVKVIQGSSYTTGHAYDSADRLTTVTLPGGEVITLAFNDRGLPLSATSSASGTIASGALYNRLGLLTQLDYGGNASRTTQEHWGVEHLGTPSNIRFGQLYRLYTSQVSGTSTFQDLRYTWDAAGNLSQREDALHSTTKIFTYDDLHRLTSATGTYARTYTYDAHDNITFKTGPGTYTYGTSTKPHLLSGTTQNPGAYAYDANGNTTSRPGQTLTWNSENLLASVFNTAAGTTTESYVYDGDRVRVVGTSSSEGTIHYVNRYFQKNVTSGTTTVSYWLGDRLVAFNSGTSTEFIHVDHLGSAAARSDSSGAGAWRAYYPFGELRTSSGSIAGDRSFTGQRLDSATGLYFYNARYYDPAIGRFISPDSLVPDPYDPRNYNRFAYVLNNPLRYTDPSGHFCIGKSRWAQRCRQIGKAAAQAAVDVADHVRYQVEYAVEQAVKTIKDPAPFIVEQIVESYPVAQAIGVQEVQIVQDPELGRVNAIVAKEGGLLDQFIESRSAEAITIGKPIGIISRRTIDINEFGEPEDLLWAHDREHVRQFEESGLFNGHIDYQVERWRTGRAGLDPYAQHPWELPAFAAEKRFRVTHPGKGLVIE